MGNECCVSERKPKKSAFTDQEVIQLMTLYNDLTELKRGKKKKTIDKTTLNELFNENPHLSEAIYKLFKANSDDPENVNYDTFQASVELLVKEPASFQLVQYRDREKLDMLALIIIGEFEIGREELKNIYLNYLQAIDFMKMLLRVFQYQRKILLSVDEYAAKVVADAVFEDIDHYLDIDIVNKEIFIIVIIDGDDQGQIDWWKFISYIKENMIYVNRCLKLYFTTKFLRKPVNLQLPNLNKGSYILNRDLIGLLYFSNVYLHSAKQLEFLYSSNYHGFSFAELVQVLSSYAGPTFLLFKFVPDKQESTSPAFGEEKSFIIGGFSRLRWKDTGVYHGDSDCYIFSLTPKFKNFFASTKSSANTNYIYLNSKGGNRVGLGNIHVNGFGGNLNDDFRIFLDGKDPKKSYIRSQDNTYNNGALIEPNYKIRFEYIEVWGLGTELSIIEETAYIRRGVGSTTSIRESFVETLSQPKSMEIREDAIQFSKTQEFLEAKIAELTQGRRSQKKPVTEENVKRSAFRGIDADLQRGSAEREKKAGYMDQRNSYEVVSGDKLVDFQPKPRSTHIASYGYYNPFK